ncbi:MAG: hypothetical protein WDN28_15065 [Chthoniobacter sp.]
MDIVSGPYWYEGPDFKVRHEYNPATQTFQRLGADGKEETIAGFEGGLGTKNVYSDNSSPSSTTSTAMAGRIF